MRRLDPGPPRMAEWVLRSLLPADVHGRTILGDLQEEYREIDRSRGSIRAGLWYWRQTLVLGVGYVRPGSATLSTTAQDLRHTLRGLRRSRVLTLSVVMTMALAIGAGTAVFSLVDAVLLRPLPFDRPEELVRVWAAEEAGGQPYVDMMYGDIDHVRKGVSGFASVTGFSVAPRTLLDWGMENPEDVAVARTSADFLTTLGVAPVVGRGFSAEEETSGAPVVIISNALWQRRFAGDPEVIGSKFHIDAGGYEVIGVLPDGMQYPEDVHIWRPLTPEEVEDDDREVQVLARLNAGVSPPAAAAELQSMATALAELTPGTHQGFSAWLQPLQAMVVKDVRTALYAFLGAVGLVLLISCVNTANLLLARAADRRHEIAVRTSLGASRGRLVRAHLTESLVLAMMGGALGLLIGRWALAAVLALTPRLPRLETVTLDMRVMGVMALVAAVAGVLAGVVPALHAASSAPAAALRESGTGKTGSGSRMRIQSGLVATEVALATLLAFLAVLLFGTFRSVIDHDRGFVHDNLSAFEVDPFHPPVGGDETRAYFDRIVEGVRAIPSVREAAISSHPILEQRGLQVDIEVEGRPRSGSAQARATLRIVSEGFFRTAGIPFAAGRPMGPEGGVGDDLELVVNRAFVGTLLSDEADPLGAYVSTEVARGHIVGVVGDVSPSIGEPAQPIVYLPFAQLTVPGAWLMVRTEAPPAAIASDVWREILAVDRYLLSTETVVVEEAVQASVAPQRFNMLILVTFSGLALALAAVGIYGVTSYTVSARREEIGIRRALGASQSRIASEVMSRLGRVVAVGVVVGLGAAVAGGRLVRSLFVGVEPSDPRILMGTAGILAVVSLAAAALPVLRAIHITPTEALRKE